MAGASRRVHRQPPDIVLSGPLCSGKSTLAAALVDYGYSIVTAVSAIESHAGRAGLSRLELQEIGVALERSQPGIWLARAAAAAPRPVVLDAARTAAQLTAAERLLDNPVLVHLTAPVGVRRKRFVSRPRPSDSEAEFDTIAATALEQGAEAAGCVADLEINTDDLPSSGVLRVVLDHLRIAL